MTSTEHRQPSFNLRLHQFALAAVAIGVAVGAFACLYAWVARGEFAQATIAGAAFGATAAIPVWRKYRRLVGEQSGAGPAAV